MRIPTASRKCSTVAEFTSLQERIRSTCVDRSQRRMTMDEKRMARLFGLTLGGLFAISLILNAIAI
jgi:hypothetical protein